MDTSTQSSNSRHSPRRFTICLSILLLVINIGCTTTASPKPPEQPATSVAELSPTATAPSPTEPPPTPTMPSPTATSDTTLPAGWVSHTSQRCEYSLSLPADMRVSHESVSSSTFSINLENPNEGTPNFIYVSVINQESQNLNAEYVYNYTPGDADRLISLQIGESGPLNDFEQFAEWLTYQRLPDTTINGYTVQAFENVKPWEFPEGTKEIRFYLTLDGCLYQVGGYMDTTQSNLPGAITEDLFYQVVDTFRPMP